MSALTYFRNNEEKRQKKKRRTDFSLNDQGKLFVTKLPDVVPCSSLITGPSFLDTCPSVMTLPTPSPDSPLLVPTLPQAAKDSSVGESSAYSLLFGTRDVLVDVTPLDLHKSVDTFAASGASMYSNTLNLNMGDIDNIDNISYIGNIGNIGDMSKSTDTMVTVTKKPVETSKVATEKSVETSKAVDKGKTTTTNKRKPRSKAGVIPLEAPIPLSFVAPPKVDVNQYWTYIPIPKLVMFRAILESGSGDRPNDSNEQDLILPPLNNYEARIAAVRKLQGEEKVCELEAERQREVLERARLLYEHEMKREKQRQPRLDHLREECEAQATLLKLLQKTLTSYIKDVNSTQCHVLTELDQLVEGQSTSVQSDSSQSGKLSQQVVEETMAAMGDASQVKATFKTRLGEIKGVTKRLEAHLPRKKNKYEPSGKFTKEMRIERKKNARPYNKTGKHIHDYQNPRFAKQRDEQIAKRAEKLGVNQDVIKFALVGDQ